MAGSYGLNRSQKRGTGAPIKNHSRMRNPEKLQPTFILLIYTVFIGYVYRIKFTRLWSVYVNRSTSIHIKIFTWFIIGDFSDIYKDHTFYTVDWITKTNIQKKKLDKPGNKAWYIKTLTVLDYSAQYTTQYEYKFEKTNIYSRVTESKNEYNHLKGLTYGRSEYSGANLVCERGLCQWKKIKLPVHDNGIIAHIS